MVVLGGMGNIWGVAAGAFIVYMIQAVLLKQLNQFVPGACTSPILAEHQLRRSTSTCSTASPWS